MCDASTIIIFNLFVIRPRNEQYGYLLPLATQLIRPYHADRWLPLMIRLPSRAVAILSGPLKSSIAGSVNLRNWIVDKWRSGRGHYRHRQHVKRRMHTICGAKLSAEGVSRISAFITNPRPSNALLFFCAGCR